MNAAGILIIGAGLAGVSCAAELRAQHYKGPLVILNGEEASPYDRPPLSKEYAKGNMDRDEILLHPVEWYEEHGITLENDCIAREIETVSKYVTTRDGRIFPYDKLLLATGARARILPGLEEMVGNVHYIRTLADADKLKAALIPGRRFVFIGGGVIGMETAATAIDAGCEVTVLEAQPCIMGRFFPMEISEFLTGYHRDRGVDIKLNAKISKISSNVAGEINVLLEDGTHYSADELVVGIGAIPNTELGENIGVQVDNALVVDACCRTLLTDVYACGDAVEFDHPRYSRARWENWKHAKEQGRHAARSMLGEDLPYDEIPWVWSDQYDLNIQSSGTHEGDCNILRGDMGQGKFTMFHLCDGVVVGATSVNDGKNKKPAQIMIKQEMTIAPEVLADVSVNLRKIL